MGVRRILGSGAGLLALALIAPSTAPAYTPVDLPVSTSGALVYTWHGDPARGCEAAGVCGIQGSLIVHAGGFSDLNLVGPRSGYLSFGGAASTVRVRRTEAASQGDCVDPNGWPNESSGALLVRWRSDGHARLVIPRDGPSSGRCAGPLPGDLPSILPGRRLGGRGVHLAFPATRSWAAGPYSGTLVSTLRVGPGRGGASSSGSVSVPDSSSTPGPPPVAHTVLEERVMVTYRVTAAPGTITVNLRGESDPFCAALDSCSTDGALSIAFAGRRGTVSLEGDRVVSRRVSRTRALADFRAGRLSFALPGPGLMRGYKVSESLARAGGATCTDAPAASWQTFTWLGSPFINPIARLRRIPIVVEAMSFGNDFLRTRCPGPFGTEVLGDNQLMARGHIGLAQLLSAHSGVVLSPPRSFSAPGYAGTFSGTLGLRLSRIKLVVDTVRVPG